MGAAYLSASVAEAIVLWAEGALDIVTVHTVGRAAYITTERRL